MQEGVKAVTSNPAYSNVTVLVQDPTALKIPEPVDVVWISENYHDFKNNGPFKTDTNAMDKSVFAALKPGGLYVITDYEAAPWFGPARHPDVAPHRSRRDQIGSDRRRLYLRRRKQRAEEPGRQTDGALASGASQVFYKFRKPR